MAQPTPMIVDKPFESFSILKVVKDSQQKHGLRHGNYKRYGDYCTRRIQRIRRSLQFSHVYKCAPGSKTKFIKKKVTKSKLTDRKLLDIIIFDAERAWARGMEFKYNSEKENHARQIFHARRRFQKASIYAKDLEKICRTDKVDRLTKVEAQAYSAFMSGVLNMESKDWAKALENCRSAKVVYDALLQVTKDKELSELYDGRCKELANAIKLCEYNCGIRASTTPGKTDPEIEYLVSQFQDNISLAYEFDAKTAQDIVKSAPKKEATPAPPKPTPVPAKPLFFDLVLNHFRIPDEVEEFVNRSAAEQEQSLGITGMVKNLFWGSK